MCAISHKGGHLDARESPRGSGGKRFPPLSFSEDYNNLGTDPAIANKIKGLRGFGAEHGSHAKEKFRSQGSQSKEVAIHGAIPKLIS